MEKYSVEIAKAVQEFMEDDDWHFSFDDRDGIFSFGLAARNKIKHLNYHILVRNDGYTVYAVSPIGGDQDDKEMMLNMSEFICRANYGLRNGNFELDFDDGEIRYKVFVDCDGGVVPACGIIKNSIYTAASMFKRYSGGILDIINQNVPAKNAIAKCEGKIEDEIQTMLEELVASGDEETKSMIERLEARLGISSSQEREKERLSEDESIDE